MISETYNNIVSEIDKKLIGITKRPFETGQFQEDYNDIADEIYRLREERHRILTEEAGRKGSKQRLEELEQFLNEQSCELEEYVPAVG